MKKLFKSIAMVLSLTIIVEISPIIGATAFANEDDRSGAVVEPKTVEIVQEVSEKRTENTKHFRLSNGTYLATQYSEPVHYLDGNGIWQDYDNTLRLDNSEETEELQEYTTKKSNFSIRLAKQAKCLCWIHLQRKTTVNGNQPQQLLVFV